TSFTSLAIATGFERRYGIIKRLGASPLPRWGLLFGKIGAVVLIEVVQLAVLSGVGLALGWQPHGGVAAIVLTVVLIVLWTAAFGSLGLLIAGTLRAEATLAVANLVYVLLLVGGGLLVPLSRYPEAARHVLELLPSGALGQGLRDTFAGHGPSAFATVVLLIWTVCASLLVSKTFKWE
ncbi:MAG: transporter, partial [Aeromicrobium sp.]|nr:transporter [Aeromicrobium sp.]